MIGTQSLKVIKYAKGGGRNKPLIENFAAAVRMVWVCV